MRGDRIDRELEQVARRHASEPDPLSARAIRTGAEVVALAPIVFYAYKAWGWPGVYVALGVVILAWAAITVYVRRWVRRKTREIEQTAHTPVVKRSTPGGTLLHLPGENLERTSAKHTQRER